MNLHLCIRLMNKILNIKKSKSKMFSKPPSIEVNDKWQIL